MTSTSTLPPSAAKIKILSTNATNIEERMTVLYMGKPKSGKTHAVCSWPKPLVIYFDKNELSLTKYRDVDYIRPGIDTESRSGSPWAHFQWEILPAIQNRALDFETIVVDSWSQAFTDLVDQEKRSGLKKWDLWGSVFEKGMSAIKILLDAARPDPWRPELRSYHILGTVHEQPETDGDGNLVEVLPALQGQSRSHIARMFNTVLICASEITTDMVQGKAVRKPRYFAWTLPPDRYRACGDGVGIEGGKYNVLPPQVDPTYQGLTQAWNMKSTESKSKSNSPQSGNS